ncbi:MAG TPA: hypothetical protein VGF15_00385 [Solirubrobacteraceae bacterium]|jgi:hypothetical protein
MRTTLAVSAALIALFAAAAASAQTGSITIGQLALSSSELSECQSKHAYLQSESASGQLSYTVPAPGGVITSWSEAPAGRTGSERLLVARPTTTQGRYTVLALSPVETVSGTENQTFPVRIPVQAGDLLGLEPTTPGLFCTFSEDFGYSGDLVGVLPGEPSEGETLTVEPALSKKRLNVTGTLEPDADHDGYGDISEDRCPTDPSTHEACPLPVISGVAAIGQTLSANAGGEPENPSYAWLRCGGEGSGCYAIPGASGLTYTVVPVDVGHTLRLRKTASNSQDTQVSESEPTALIAFATAAAITPRLSGVSQSSSHWREGGALARFSSRAKGPIGTTFSFTLNLPVPVTLSFTQKASGRLVSNRCVAQSTHNQHRPGCTRTVTAGVLRSTAHIGKNTVTFQGRLSHSVKLKAGLYTMTITAGSSGQHSASRSLTFRIFAS